VVAARRPDARSSARPSPRPAAAAGGTGLARTDGGNQQLVQAAGSAIVTAARVGRLLGRSGWRIARQLPGVSLVEQQVQRLGDTATAELRRLLDVPGQLFTPAGGEDARVMMLVQNASTDPAPLRTAMSELLSRSSDTGAGRSREYLYGTIVSQLVPDEARILAAMADGKSFAAVDVQAKHVGRPASRTVLSNASTVGAAAKVTPARNVATYLTRLHGFGLVEFGPAADELNAEYDQLAIDDAVQEARVRIEKGKLGSVRVVRKTVALSTLGRDFWTACSPGSAPRP
jgi:hypothetical protein